MKHRTSWTRFARTTSAFAIVAAALWSCGTDSSASGNGGNGGSSGGVAGSGTAGSASGSAGSSAAGSASGSAGSSTASGGAGGGTGGSAGGAGGGSGGDGGGGASGTGGSGASTGGSGGVGGLSGDSGDSSATGGSAGVAAAPDGGGAGGDSGRPDAGHAALAFTPPRAVLGGLLGVTNPPSSQTLQLHNGGQNAAQVSKLALSGTNQSLFTVTSPKQFPASIAPGADLPVTLELTAAAHALPAQTTTEKDKGMILLTAELTATVDAAALVVPTYALVGSKSNYEATMGQILSTLGYTMNVGKAQSDWNWNNKAGNDPRDLAFEPGTDEVAAQTFVKAGSGEVTIVPVARYSPEGAMDFGWYPPGKPDTRTKIATLASIPDGQTSNKARMVYPPLVAGGKTSFDPGATAFGLWAYSGQAMAGSANGDYNYSQDNLNVPAPTIHRVKSWTLKTASGPIANSYLVGFEEAANGDYQDYVFILGNVKPAP